MVCVNRMTSRLLIILDETNEIFNYRQAIRFSRHIEYSSFTWFYFCIVNLYLFPAELSEVCAVFYWPHSLDTNQHKLRSWGWWILNTLMSGPYRTELQDCTNLERLWFPVPFCCRILSKYIFFNIRGYNILIILFTCVHLSHLISSEDFLSRLKKYSAVIIQFFTLCQHMWLFSIINWTNWKIWNSQLVLLCYSVKLTQMLY